MQKVNIRANVDQKRRTRFINHLSHEDDLVDLRVHADMFPENPQDIFRACLAGVRRQRY